MIHHGWFGIALGLGSVLVVAGEAAAAVWSVQADCKRGDWSVEVTLTGFGAVDASCIAGKQTRLLVDVGEVAVEGGSIAATSSAGTLCDLAPSRDWKFGIECERESESFEGFEWQEELEVEVEREQKDDVENEEEPEAEQEGEREKK